AAIDAKKSDELRNLLLVILLRGLFVRSFLMFAAPRGDRPLQFADLKHPPCIQGCVCSARRHWRRHLPASTPLKNLPTATSRLTLGQMDTSFTRPCFTHFRLSRQSPR